ncbi:MAG: phosphate acetyltransferase [Elusimicrobia bacterium]|nr:phosphate acetyltransferase [Elusimicrobiota bacterium]
MNVIENIRRQARANSRSIVLPEGEEPRTLAAAGILAREQLARAVLLGDPEKIGKDARSRNIDLSGVKIVDPRSDPKKKLYAEKLAELRKHKGLEASEAEKILSDPIMFGTMMLESGDVDGFLAGAIHATADTVRPALQIIRPAPGVRTISSFFIMVVPDCSLGDNGVFIFADCAINPDPSPAKLAGIAVASARMGARLCGLVPRVAMLSFSTKGSAEHELVERVREAARLAKEKAPDLDIDGELQADAALIPEIGERKAPGSSVAGKANVLIFPDLQSANIAYKLVQRLAKAEAIGPILQGFNKPVNDLSRGCSVDDIVNLAAVTAIQAGFGAN